MAGCDRHAAISRRPYHAPVVRFDDYAEFPQIAVYGIVVVQVDIVAVFHPVDVVERRFVGDDSVSPCIAVPGHGGIAVPRAGELGVFVKPGAHQAQHLRRRAVVYGTGKAQLRYHKGERHVHVLFSFRGDYQLACGQIISRRLVRGVFGVRDLYHRRRFFVKRIRRQRICLRYGSNLYGVRLPRKIRPQVLDSDITPGYDKQAEKDK